MGMAARGVIVPTVRAHDRYLGSDLLQRFAMLGDIEPLELLFGANPQRREHADQLEQHVGRARPTRPV